MNAVVDVTLARLDYLARGAAFLARDQTIASPGRWRRLDFVELLLVTAGSARLVCTHPDGVRSVRRLEPGRLVLFRSGDDTEFTDLGPDGFSVRFVAFPTEEWRSFATLAALDSAWATAPDPLDASVGPADPDVSAAYDLALDRYRADPTPFDLLQFWMSVAHRVVPFRPALTRGAGTPDWLTRSIDAMRNESDLREGVPRLRVLAHVSASHLAATVRRYYNATPTELIVELRVRHAAHLLSTTSLSVGEVARRCGFSSLTYLGRCFRAAYQVSPRRYRTRIKGSGYGAPPSPV